MRGKGTVANMGLVMYQIPWREKNKNMGCDVIILKMLNNIY